MTQIANLNAAYSSLAKVHLNLFNSQDSVALTALSNLLELDTANTNPWKSGTSFARLETGPQAFCKH